MVIATDSWPLKTLDQQVNYELHTLTILDFLLFYVIYDVFSLRFIFTGSDNGLNLLLNVEQYEYMPGPNDAAGVKVLTHVKDDHPRVRELGIAVPTGTQAFIGLQVIMVSDFPNQVMITLMTVFVNALKKNPLGLFFISKS